MSNDEQNTEQKQPEQDSELKQNLVAAGKIGGVMVVGLGLLFLFVLIVLLTQLG